MCGFDRTGSLIGLLFEDLFKTMNAQISRLAEDAFSKSSSRDFDAEKAIRSVCFLKIFFAIVFLVPFVFLSFPSLFMFLFVFFIILLFTVYISTVRILSRAVWKMLCPLEIGLLNDLTCTGLELLRLSPVFRI